MSDLESLLQRTAADILRKVASERRPPAGAKNDLGDLANIDPLCRRLCGLDDIDGNTVQIYVDPAAESLHRAHAALREPERDTIIEFGKSVSEMVLRQTPADHMPMRKTADAPRAAAPQPDFHISGREDCAEFSAHSTVDGAPLAKGVYETRVAEWNAQFEFDKRRTSDGESEREKAKMRQFWGTKAPDHEHPTGGHGSNTLHPSPAPHEELTAEQQREELKRKLREKLGADNEDVAEFGAALEQAIHDSAAQLAAAWA